MQLLILALEAALYPTLLAAVVILLTLDRPVRLLAAYLAGGLTISIGLGIVIVEALGGTVDSSSSTTSVSVDLAVGGLALLIAVVLATHTDERLRGRRSKAPKPKPEEEHEPWSERILSRGSTPLVFFAAMAVNVPGAAYLVALKDIAAGNDSTGTDIALIVVFNLIMFMLAEIPLAGLVFAPERTQTLVARGNEWLSSHGRELAIGVCATLGAFLIVRGIVHAT